MPLFYSLWHCYSCFVLVTILLLQAITHSCQAEMWNASHFAIAPDTATFSLALPDLSFPVPTENPFTLGLYFLIMSEKQ